MQLRNDARLPVDCLVDAHIHAPRQGINGASVRNMIKLLVHSGIGGLVFLGVPDFSQVIERIDYLSVKREYERVKSLIDKYAWDIRDYLEPHQLYVATLNMAKEYGPICSESMATVVENVDIMAAVDLSMDIEDLARWLREARSKGFGGYKVLSTLFLTSLDDERIEVILDEADSHGLPVVVHGGCDPGIWELPAYCKYGDPSKLAPLIRNHRDAKIVIAHAGGYSAIAPGVFIEETLELARRFDNVYVDTSALPPYMAARVALTFPRVIYGSDYPVVVKDRITQSALRYAEEVLITLMLMGAPKSKIRRFTYETAEEVFNLECKTAMELRGF